MLRLGWRVRSAVLLMALACGAARAASPDAETPDCLIPDAPSATIETHRDAAGRLQIEIKGERFDGRRLIGRLLADLRDGAPTSTNADFDLHIAVGTLAGHNGEELRDVDMRLARRAGRLDKFALTARTPGGTAVRGEVSGGGEVWRALHLEADDAGAFLRFVDLYGRLAKGRMWLTIGVQATQKGVIGLFGMSDFDLAAEPVLQPVLKVLTPPPGPPQAQDAPPASPHLRGGFTLWPDKVVVKNTVLFDKLVTATLEGRIEAGELDLRGMLAPAILAHPPAEPCSSSPCLRGMSYRVTGPIGAPRLLINPFMETIWRFVPPP